MNVLLNFVKHHNCTNFEKEFEPIYLLQLSSCDDDNVTFDKLVHTRSCRFLLSLL